MAKNALEPTVVVLHPHYQFCLNRAPIWEPLCISWWASQLELCRFVHMPIIVPVVKLSLSHAIILKSLQLFVEMIMISYMWVLQLDTSDCSNYTLNRSFLKMMISYIGWIFLNIASKSVKFLFLNPRCWISFSKPVSPCSIM